MATVEPKIKSANNIKAIRNLAKRKQNLGRPRREFLCLAVNSIHNKVFFGPDGCKDLVVNDRESARSH